MKIAHLADLHFSPKNLARVSPAMDEAITKAIAMGAELAVIAGDTFDSSMGIHEPAVMDFLTQIHRLADHMPVVVIQGTFSHDRPGSLDVLNRIGRDNVHVFDIVTMDSLSLHGRKVNIFVIPSINKASTEVIALGGPRAWVAEAINSCRGSIEEDKSDGIPTIFLSHGTVNGSRTESNHAMISPDHEFSTETLFSSGASAIMLGHIHLHQHWENGNGQVIAYAGSLARLVFGHTAPTGFLLWDVQPGSATFEFVPVHSPQMIDLDFSGAPDMAVIAAAAASAEAGVEVRLSWQVDEEFRHLADKAAIRAMFPTAAQVKLNEVINPIQRVRAQGIGGKRSLTDRLAVWAETSSTPMDGLVDRLMMLQEGKEPQQIIEEMMK